MNRSPRRNADLWRLTITAITLAGVATRAIAGELLFGMVGSWFGNALGLVLAAALVVSLVSVGLSWRARRHPQPGSLTPPEEQPEAGVVENLPHVTGFVGRQDVLRDIIAAEDGAVAVVGRRGVGTSACVKRAALLLAEDDFPDGAHYLNLRAENSPLPAHQVVGALARRFGSPVPASDDPVEVRTSAARLRERLADPVEDRGAASTSSGSSGGHGVGRRERRVLLVLDNIDDPAQVEPLLPLPRQCRVLLAGCPDLGREGGVPGVGHSLRLGEPTPAEAGAMFRSAARAGGDQAGKLDPGRDPAVRRLIELCGRMPRPVRALAYQMALHHWPADDLLAALRRLVATPAHQEVRYVEALDLVADQDVAYTALSPAARRVYRRLALAPGPVEPDAVAVLDRPPVLARLPRPRRLGRWAHDRAVRRARRLISELVTAGFAEAPRGGCRIRPPFGPYARMHLRRDEPPASRVRAELRLTRHLTRQAERCAARLATTGSASRIGALPRPGDERDPCLWFELHHRTMRRLVTRAAGGPVVAPQVQPRRLRRWWFRAAVAVCTWYAAAGPTRDWEWICTNVLTTPTAGDRRRITSWARNELGVIRRRQGQPARAHDTLAHALRERGHWGESQVLTNIGLALLAKGDPASVKDATWHLRAAAGHRSPGDRNGIARTDLGLGLAHLAGGDLVRARDHLWRAVQAFDRLDDDRNAAAARSDLGLVYWQLGERQEAWETLERAVHDYWRLKQTSCDRLIDRTGEAAALLNLGAALVTTGWSLVETRQRRGATRPDHVARADALLTESRELRGPAPTAGLGRTLLYQGDAAHLLGKRHEACGLWRQAAEICHEVDDTAGLTAAGQRLYIAWCCP